MKLRGAGWLIGTAVTITSFGLIGACDDSDPAAIGVTLDGGNVNGFDGGGADGNTTDGTTNDSGQDANKPETSLPAQCNDGKVDQGETCDPLDKCPTDCPADKCNLRALENGGTCAAVCTTVAVQTQCQNGDGCCPDNAGCSISNDSDCTAVCGNGIKEAGEECDGADCPTTAADCPAIGCQQRTLQGDKCSRKCVNTTLIATCSAGNDQCCPAGGACAGTDPDCGMNVCGNGTVDPPAETCDLNIAVGTAGACPTACKQDKCVLPELVNPRSCQAECKDTGKRVSACVNGDGCCPTGCNTLTDTDCLPTCGNNVKEAGELCDGDCPTECKPSGCQLFVLEGDPLKCTATCRAAGQETKCTNDDRCCPANGVCSFSTDNDCPAPTCGNGKIDPGETCDDGTGSPKPCDCAKPKGCIGAKGSAATCDLVCDQPLDVCSDRTTDLCCPYDNESGKLCGASNDKDCKYRNWRSISYKDDPNAVISYDKATPCAAFTFTNIEPGASYEVTTCSPQVVASGDVAITQVLQLPSKIETVGTNYGKNDNCLDEKFALPYRAGFQCQNTKGATTMACVAENTGGFIVSNGNDLQITICASTISEAPFTLFYNSTLTPKLSAIVATKP